MKRKTLLDPQITGFNELLQNLEDDKLEQPLPASNAVKEHEKSGLDLHVDMIREKSKAKEKNRRVSQA